MIARPYRPRLRRSINLHRLCHFERFHSNFRARRATLRKAGLDSAPIQIKAIDSYYYRGSITAVAEPMSRTKIHRLGDLQLRIMQILWARDEATVADVHAVL